MVRKLGKSITIMNAIAFLAVILVGGISIYLTKDILHNAYKIETLSKDIITVDSINTDAYRLITDIHHFLIEQDELYSRESIDLISALKKKVEDYRAQELKELSTKKNLEIQHLDTILEDIKGLTTVQYLFESFSKTGKFNREELISLEEFAYELEETTKEINKIHLDKIKQSTDKSLTNMWIILCIYLVFITIGGLTIYTGHYFVLKKIVTPIKELAAATNEIAEGTFNKRVDTDSRNEIGQLYQSFNKMARKLQENDEFLRTFNEELETKVHERTVELQKTNEQLQKIQNELIRTERISAMGQVAADVTHEIKNPLNSLSINTQMLLKDLLDKFGPESPFYETASLIRSEINRINNILEEFVKYAKFPEPRFFNGSINQVVKETADLIYESAKNADVKIKLSLQEDLPEFKFDQRQFKEVLINLSQNAVRAMNSGGILEIKTAVSDENVIINVSDTGEGIPEKNLDKIFAPFFSTKERGLGLGLPIVQRIVESHGGKISCSSKVDEGTVFKLVVPLEGDRCRI